MSIQRLDRMAVIVMSREPLIDWANGISPEAPVWVDDIADRADVYLIPHYETAEEAEEYVRKNFDEIFRNELSEWFEDESLWPKDRTYEMFVEWFDVLYDVAVFDAQPRHYSVHRN